MTQEEDYLSLQIIKEILFGGKKLAISGNTISKIQECYDFLDRFSHERIIYGINTGFGPMAQYRVSEEDRTALQYNIIRSHATGAGEPLPNIYVKAAMIARLGTFLQAQSGVHPEVVNLLLSFINNNIIPFIPEHGSVGASGDLVQLAHLALTLIGEGKVNYNGEWQDSGKVLKELGIKPFGIHIREGLSITNGTSFMTGIGLVNLFNAQRLFHWALTASVLVNEIVSSFDDLMSETLNGVRRQQGQQKVAAKLREIATGSGCMLKRENEMYKHHEEKVFKHKVQPYYSLRCIPQIMGPILETIENTARVLENEVNSACDNPIVDVATQNVYHGGNFHGDYVSFEMDKLKMAVTKMTMTMERQMNYLFHDRINGGILPPFVNLGTLGLNYGLQASQFTATSTTAECQTLSNPMYVHSIPNNNDNQDIVSMGTNSALIAKRVINNAFQVMAIHYMTMAQAVDYLKIQDKLAPATRKVYDEVRKIFPVFTEDYPLYTSVAAVEEYLKKADIRN
ncbi:MAG: aromatic amino acid lyase [Paludibacteraceae bacterium]|nr:aromatic amino acid lyase [Paludibacteraceae bacterium]MBR6103665.1 aromatic amino acid lyase [Paludibacteraceae bacterium]